MPLWLLPAIRRQNELPVHLQWWHVLDNRTVVVYCVSRWPVPECGCAVQLQELRRRHVQSEYRSLFLLLMPLRLVPGEHWPDVLQQLPRWEVQLWDGPYKL
jgi:hypothetical protein